MTDGSGTVVVIGAGTSGIAAARVLAGLSPVSDGHSSVEARRVILLEAGEELGGKVRSGRVGPDVIDLGPDQFLRRNPSAERLCRSLGLGEDLIEPAVRNAAVYSRGEMRMLPRGLVLGIPTDVLALEHSGIVSLEGVARLQGDQSLEGPVLTAENLGLRGDGETEIPAGELLRRRLGDEVVDRLVDPLLGGINAGRIDDLSLGLVAPSIAAALVGEREVLAPLRATVSSPPSASSPFFGLRGGLSRMTAACLVELEGSGVCVARGVAAVGLSRERGGFVVSAQRGGKTDKLRCDGVVLAVPAYGQAELLRGISEEAARELSAIEYASVATVTLSYRPETVSLPPGSSGLLVPRVEGTVMSAATWLSEKWPWVGAGGRAIVRVSAGREGDERPQELSDDELVETARDELTRVAGIEAVPEVARVARFERSFPQYRPGHAGVVRRALALLEEVGAVELAGATMGGIGIPACITSGESAAVRIAARLPP